MQAGRVQRQCEGGGACGIAGRDEKGRKARKAQEWVSAVHEMAMQLSCLGCVSTKSDRMPSNSTPGGGTWQRGAGV